MPINSRAETLISLPEAADAVPGGVHLSTVGRWASVGCRGVLLDTVVLGARRYTSHEALDRFFVATDAVANDARQGVTHAG